MANNTSEKKKKRNLLTDIKDCGVHGFKFLYLLVVIILKTIAGIFQLMYKLISPLFKKKEITQQRGIGSGPRPDLQIPPAQPQSPKP